MSSEIESISKDIRKKKKKWQEWEDSTCKHYPRIKEKMDALHELQPLEKKIDGLKARKASALNMEEIISFHTEDVFQALLKTVHIRGVKGGTNGERVLISDKKLYDLSTGE